MLKPSMQELMKRVGNRYLLVNLAAQRARDIADQAEETGEQLSDKAVKLALVLRAGGQEIDTGRFNGAVPQHVGKTGYVPGCPVKQPCEQMPQVVRKYLGFCHSRLLAQALHLRPNLFS